MNVMLKDLIARLPCMQQYEVAVQQQLARTLELDELEEGRFVIKQGHNGTSFYIVVSGRLHVTIQNVNKQTGWILNSRVSQIHKHTNTYSLDYFDSGYSIQGN